jgi:hypothetical protein
MDMVMGFDVRGEALRAGEAALTVLVVISTNCTEDHRQ